MPTALESALASLVAGDYEFEPRMMLSADLGEQSFAALNDAAIVRGGHVRVLNLEVLVDGTHLATWLADGVVVATPTGSTAYSFSAGGPILDPTARNLIVTPIAAYLASIRSIVVSPRHTVAVRVVSGDDCLCQHRRPRGSPARGRIRGRDQGARSAAAFRRAARCAAVLAIATPEGRLVTRLTMRLLELAVRDLALIENVRVSFPAGFSVITGETGAGKSLLIDALTLVLGGRADTGLVRHGAETARVEALFDGVPEPLICVREVGAGGRSVARIDDETVTAGRLAAVVGPLRRDTRSTRAAAAAQHGVAARHSGHVWRARAAPRSCCRSG